MPRKKKRSSKKPPLRFEESPVNIVKNLPSPLRSCDNPVTAEVVPVNESSRFPWVRSVSVDGLHSTIHVRVASTSLSSRDLQEAFHLV